MDACGQHLPAPGRSFHSHARTRISHKPEPAYPKHWLLQPTTALFTFHPISMVCDSDLKASQPDRRSKFSEAVDGSQEVGERTVASAVACSGLEIDAGTTGSCQRAPFERLISP